MDLKDEMQRKFILKCKMFSIAISITGLSSIEYYL